MGEAIWWRKIMATGDEMMEVGRKRAGRGDAGRVEGQGFERASGDAESCETCEWG